MTLLLVAVLWRETYPYKCPPRPTHANTHTYPHKSKQEDSASSYSWTLYFISVMCSLWRMNLSPYTDWCLWLRELWLMSKCHRSSKGIMDHRQNSCLKAKIDIKCIYKCAHVTTFSPFPLSEIKHIYDISHHFYFNRPVSAPILCPMQFIYTQ